MPLFIKDIAGFFNVSKRAIYRWINERHLPVHHVNHQYRFDPAELFEWAIMTGNRVSPDIFHASKIEPVPSIADALQDGEIFYGIEGGTREAVLVETVKRMRLSDDVDRESLTQVLLKRKAVRVVGVGDGIAIPHVRGPIILHLPRPMIMLCFLKKPVDFGVFEGQSLTTLFTLICPTVRTHLYLLSRLGFILLSPVLKAALVRQASNEELIDIVRQIEADLPPSGTVLRAWSRLQQDLSCS